MQYSRNKLQILEFFFRFVNMLYMTKLDQEDVWKVIRKTRLSLLSESDIDCKSADIILSSDTDTT